MPATRKQKKHADKIRNKLIPSIRYSLRHAETGQSTKLEAKAAFSTFLDVCRALTRASDGEVSGDTHKAYGLKAYAVHEANSQLAECDPAAVLKLKGAILEYLQEVEKWLILAAR